MTHFSTDIATKPLTAHIDTLTLKARLYQPNSTPNGVTLFCLPGGGLTQDYFNLDPDFSFIQIMQNLGYTIVTQDNFGTGENVLPDTYPFHTPRHAAHYLSQALAIWQQDGSITPPIIGIGHSMGGMMMMLMQGKYKPFTALGLFGSSAGGLDWGLSEEEKIYINQDIIFERDLESLSLAKFKMAFTRSGGGPSGQSIVFGGQNPALTQRLRDISCKMNSAAALMSMMRGSFQTEVSAIDVPILFAFGDHDIGIPPQDVPKDFINAPKTDLIILKNTGHNHFAFSSIKPLCNKLDHWASNLLNL